MWWMGVRTFCVASSHVMSALFGYAPAVLVGVIAAVRAR
jgi:hypothetical protein